MLDYMSHFLFACIFPTIISFLDKEKKVKCTTMVESAVLEKDRPELASSMHHWAGYLAFMHLNFLICPLKRVPSRWSLWTANEISMSSVEPSASCKHPIDSDYFCGSVSFKRTSTDTHSQRWSASVFGEEKTGKSLCFAKPKGVSFSWFGRI